MKQIAVFLAEGFEEIEGLTVTDLLRRAGVTVTNVSVTGEKTVHGSHGIGVEADALFEEMEFEGMDMLVLPGGMPGTKHLKEHRDLCALLKEFYAKERYLAAICAAPTVFGELGFLEGRKACCYPGMESGLSHAETNEEPVNVDGHMITSRGPGTGNRDSIRIEADRAPVRKGKGRRNRAWSSLLLKSTGNIEVTMLY